MAYAQYLRNDAISKHDYTMFSGSSGDGESIFSVIVNVPVECIMIPKPRDL